MKAVDPICGMSVDTEKARFTVVEADRTVYFCAERCRQQYLARPPGR